MMMKHFSYSSQVARAITSVGLGGLLMWGGTSPAIAGGFTQPKGEVFTSATFRTFESGDFEKLELQGYVEYGLRDDTTLILKVPYQFLEQAGLTNEGFSDIELGARWRYFKNDSIAASIQGILIIPPGIDPNETPALGTNIVGAELRLPVSQSFKLGNLDGYWTAEIAYRDYFGAQSDELRIFAEVNQSIAKPVSVAAQLDFVSALQDGAVFRPEETNIAKLIGQVRLKVLDKTTLVLGGFTNVTGTDASGIEIQLWHSFNP